MHKPMSTPDNHFPLALSYPPAPMSDVVDDYHGVRVSDPYRPLEAADAPATNAWVEAENAVTQAFIGAIPERAAIKARLTDLVNYERFGIPLTAGGHYFWTRNTGLQNQSVLYVADDPASDGRILLDPNTLSEDGTVALAGWVVSDDGTYLAYGIAVAGSDWNEWRVRDIESGADLPDHLRWVKFSGASWAKDGSGFYYARYDEPTGQALSDTNYFHKLYFHHLGDDQSADTLVYERLDQKEWILSGGVTDDGAFLIIIASQGSDEKNRVFLKRLDTPDAPVIPLFADGDATYHVLGNDSDRFYVLTNHSAPRKRVIAVTVSSPDPTTAQTLVPESPRDLLQDVSLFGDTFVATYLHDAHTRIETFTLSGEPSGIIALPGIGTAFGFHGKRSDTETFFGFTGFTNPFTTYRYDLQTRTVSLFRAPNVAFDSAQFTTTQVFVSSKDETPVPLFLTHRKGISLDSTNPTYLYGYGGFNAAMTPFFSTNAVTWMEMGGVFAVAVLRGGGEYGREWHEAGMKQNKQNVFDDFIAVGEYLIHEKYTSTPKLAIAGASNGGLLVGACETQRPELWGACLPAVGVMDMLRFPKFTIGWAWKSDYGDPEDADEFAALHAYSPYHRLQDGTHYPATLITTSDHDDRVVPAHSFKYAARLQAAQGGDAPVLIRIEVRAGHGAGKPISKQLEETADIYAFLVRVLTVHLPSGFAQKSGH